MLWKADNWAKNSRITVLPSHQPHGEMFAKIMYLSLDKKYSNLKDGQRWKNLVTPDHVNTCFMIHKDHSVQVF